VENRRERNSQRDRRGKAPRKRGGSSRQHEVFQTEGGGLKNKQETKRNGNYRRRKNRTGGKGKKGGRKKKKKGRNRPKSVGERNKEKAGVKGDR